MAVEFLEGKGHTYRHDAAVFEKLKPLARDLRNVLFPIRDRAIFTGTFRNSDIMYDGIINTVSRAIGRLEKEE